MATTDTSPILARPVVHVRGDESLTARVAKLGWEAVSVDAAGAESARAKELALVSDEADAWSDERLAAAVNLAVAEQAVKQLGSLRADARKAVHEAKNAIGLIWLHIAELERAAGQAAPGSPAQAKEIVSQIKEETRLIVALLDQLSATARG